MINDVPSPIDLRCMEDALAWANEAMLKRPVRTEFFASFADAIGNPPGTRCRVLELGSGPGFLMHHLLEAVPAIEYVALDFSPAMHELAREHLGESASRVTFIERSFLDPAWPEALGTFDFVVTNQAVHELRHKSRATDLHRQARGTLAQGGRYLVCDHFVGAGGMSNKQLYMTVEEQLESLREAGFVRIESRLIKGGLALHEAS